MMDKIVVLSHEAKISADNLQTKIENLTGTKFDIKIDGDNKTIKYGYETDLSSGSSSGGGSNSGDNSNSGGGSNSGDGSNSGSTSQSETAMCLCVGNGDGWTFSKTTKTDNNTNNNTNNNTSNTDDTTDDTTDSTTDSTTDDTTDSTTNDTTDSTTNTTTGDITSVELKVVSVEYDKRLFSPGNVDITLSSTCGDTAELADVLKDQLCSGSKRCSIHFLGFTGVDESNKADELINVCNNYYVHDFSISKNSTGINVTLHCYSPDKLLTLDKYSKVYCGESINTIMGNNISDKICKKSCSDADLINVGEVSFPYLVQYNESFYDFLRRIAVRCGEFLYHENGKLTLGIEASKRTRPTPISKADSELFDIEYPKVNLSNEGVTSVSLFATSSFGKDVDALSASNENSYNMEYTNDDFVASLGKEDNEDVYKDMWCNGGFLYGALGTVLAQVDTPEQVIPTFLQDGISSIADIGINQCYLKDDYEKVCGKYNVMMGLNENSNKLTNKFYHNIESKEKIVQDGTLKLDYSSNIPKLFLCDLLDLNGDKTKCYYHVSHIHGYIGPERNNGSSSGDTVKNTWDYYACDKEVLNEDSSKTVENIRENYVEVIPTYTTSKATDSEYKGETVPPHYDIPRIRKADPMEAIVKQVDDPRLLGRVRVLYRWQKESVVEKEVVIKKNDEEKNDEGKKDEGKKEKVEVKNYTPWITVSVPYSGGSEGGISMMPEKGDLVRVNFVGGNVDNPYVEGYVFHESSRPPVGAGTEKNKLTPGFPRKVISSSKGHAITFTDIEEKSSLLNLVCPPLNAIANMVYGAGKQFAGWDAWPTDKYVAPFTGGINLSDPHGIYELDLSSKNRSISVRSPFGNVNISAFTGITIEAPNGDVCIRGKNVKIEAGNNVVITSGTNIREDKLSMKNYSIYTANEFGKMFIGAAGNTIKAAAPWLGEVSKIFDLSLLRNSWEIILRPVDGTLKLESKRNTIITAGKGRVNVPKDTLSNAWTHSREGLKHYYTIQYDIVGTIRKLKDKHNELFDKFYNEMQSIKTKIEGVKAKLNQQNDKFTDDFKNNLAFANDDVFFKNLYKLVVDDEPLKEWADVATNINDTTEEKTYKKTQEDFKNIIDDFKKIFNWDAYKSEIENCLKQASQEITIKDFKSKLWAKDELFNVKLNNSDIDNTIQFMKEQAIQDGIKKKAFRKVMYQFVSEGLANYFESKDDKGIDKTYDETNPSSWGPWIDNLKLKLKTKAYTCSSFGVVDELTFGLTNFASYGFSADAIKNGSFGKLLNLEGVSGPRSIWGTGRKGQILVSNSDGNTVLLNDKSNAWAALENPVILDKTAMTTIKDILTN